MKDKSNILELEVNGMLMEQIKYFGRLDMYKQIEEYKRIYNLSEGDNYAFFYYKRFAPLLEQKTDFDLQLLKLTTNKKHNNGK